MRWYISTIINMLAQYQKLGLIYDKKTMSQSEAEADLKRRFAAVENWITASQGETLPTAAAMTLLYTFNIRLQKAILHKETLTHQRLEQLFITANVVAWKNYEERVLKVSHFLYRKDRHGNIYSEFLPNEFGVGDIDVLMLRVLERDYLKKINFDLATDPKFMLKLLEFYCSEIHFESLMVELWSSHESTDSEFGLLFLKKLLKPYTKSNNSKAFTNHIVECVVKEANTATHLSLLSDYLKKDEFDFLTADNRNQIIESMQQRAFLISHKEIKHARLYYTDFENIFNLPRLNGVNLHLMHSFHELIHHSPVTSKNWHLDFIATKLAAFSPVYPGYSPDNRTPLNEMLAKIDKNFTDWLTNTTNENQLPFGVKLSVTHLINAYLEKNYSASKIIYIPDLFDFLIGAYISAFKYHLNLIFHPVCYALCLPDDIYGDPLEHTRVSMVMQEFLQLNPESELPPSKAMLDTLAKLEFDKNVFLNFYRSAALTYKPLDQSMLSMIASHLATAADVDTMLTVIHGVKTAEQLNQLESMFRKRDFDFLKPAKNSSTLYQYSTPWENVQKAIQLMRLAYPAASQLLSCSEATMTKRC